MSNGKYRLDFLFDEQKSLDEPPLSSIIYARSNASSSFQRKFDRVGIVKKNSSSNTITETDAENLDAAFLDSSSKNLVTFETNSAANPSLNKSNKKLKKKSSTCVDLKNLQDSSFDDNLVDYNFNHSYYGQHHHHHHHHHHHSFLNPDYGTEISLDNDFNMKLMAP